MDRNCVVTGHTRITQWRRRGVAHSLGLDLAESPRWVTHANPGNPASLIIESPSGTIRYRSIMQQAQEGCRKRKRQNCAVKMKLSHGD